MYNIIIESPDNNVSVGLLLKPKQKINKYIFCGKIFFFNLLKIFCIILVYLILVFIFLYAIKLFGESIVS